MNGHAKRVTSLSVSPDNKLLASGDDDSMVKLWNISTGMEIGRLQGHSSYIQSVAFSPDGKTLVSGAYDRTIRVWQLP